MNRKYKINIQEDSRKNKRGKIDMAAAIRRNMRQTSHHGDTDNIQSSMSSMVTTCQCGALQKLSEVINVNHHWQEDYTKLQEEYNILKAKLITTERRNTELENENQTLTQRLHQQQSGINESRVETEETNMSRVKYTIDDIEALKQQLEIYKEDFLHEKNDHNQVKKDYNKIKIELQRAKSMIETLNQKNNSIKENFRRVSMEKEHIMHELRKLTTTTASSSNHHATRIPCLPYSHPNDQNNNKTMNYYTLKQQKYGSDETLQRENVHRRNSCGFYGGYVERDGLTLTAKNDGHQSA